MEPGWGTRGDNALAIGPLRSSRHVPCVFPSRAHRGLTDGRLGWSLGTGGRFYRGDADGLDLQGIAAPGDGEGGAGLPHVLVPALDDDEHTGGEGADGLEVRSHGEHFRAPLLHEPL